MTRFFFYCKKIYDKYSRDEMTVYAAQASFFSIIAIFPFLMVLLSLIQFIPAITKSSLLQLAITLVPDTLEINSVIVNMIDTLYTNTSKALLSVSAIASIWSASRGMLSIEKGLNRVFGQSQTRSYLLTRLICSGYTVVFMVICILSLTLLVLGNTLQIFLSHHFPLLGGLTGYIITFRSMLAIILTICFALVYTYIPLKKQTFLKQLPGAIFSTTGWITSSFFSSIYFNNFSNFSMTYGSLTAIVLLMLWLYTCICILFLGAEINYFYQKKPE